jgi:hypothetical protein
MFRDQFGQGKIIEVPRVFIRTEIPDAFLVERIWEDIYADFMSSTHQNAVRFIFWASHLTLY